MSDFYREAIAVALNSNSHPLVPAHHPATLVEAADILSQLPPQERCDAIYADWLMQLHNPGGAAQIQIRDLLLGQGAMDAHYLAELVQNADDSGASHLVIAMEDEWLLVANNGKPLNSLNLLGLCRFFVHSNGKVVGLTADTIGRFGIGFKASHRVAEQVVVSTWSEREGDSFGFRLPIANSRTAFSHPNKEVLDRITDRWRDLAKFQDSLRPVDQLGHCTPEYHSAPSSLLPTSLMARVSDFERVHKNGTWFGMKLHRAGQQDALRHINDPDSAILGVNPMFLRNLQEIQFQDRNITKKLGKLSVGNAGNLRISRLTFNHLTPEEGPRSERMLLIEPLETDGVWKLAIPVNSNWKLYSPGGDLPLSSSGKLHAFLPLSGLIWPHACHIHLNLPPNLARSSWNADQSNEVKRAFENIAERFAEWLLESTEEWHPEWQPSLILGRVDSQGDPTSAALEFMEQLRGQLREKDLVRSIWGNRVAAENALELLLEEGEQPRTSWFRMANRLRSHGQELLPIVPTIDSVDVLDLDRMSTDAARRLFDQIALLNLNLDQRFWDDYVWCAIGCKPQPKDFRSNISISRPVFLERVLCNVPIVRENGQQTTLPELAETEGRCRLKPDWHDLFASIARWLPQSNLSDLSFKDCGLKKLFKNLSQPCDTPATWSEVASAIESGDINSLKGIWSQAMPRCPQNLKRAIVQGLQVSSLDEKLIPLINTWVLSELHGPLTQVFDQVASKNVVMAKLQEWDLRQVYIDVVKTWLPKSLDDSIRSRIGDGISDVVSSSIFVPSQLFPLELRECVSGVLIKCFVDQFKASFPSSKTKIVLSGEVPGSKLLTLLPAIEIAPGWLTDAVVKQFCLELHVGEEVGVNFWIAGKITTPQKEELGQLLLDAYPDWKDVDVDAGTCTALSDYFSNATGNWTVRLPGNVNRRLNEFVAFPEGLEPHEYGDLNSLILAGQDPRLGEVRLLPAALQRFSPLRDAALSPSRLSFSSLDIDEFVELNEVPAGLAENKWFVELRKRVPEAKFVTHPEVPTLVYSFAEARISIQNPAFTYCKSDDDGWIVIFGSGDRRPEENGAKYAAILHHYSILSPDDKHVRQCLNSGSNFSRFYLKHREKIVNRLREVHATDLGYEARHVLRELLQNAETSYVTCARQDPDGLRSFKVHLEPLQNGSEFRVSVTHHGRTFNESLSNGQEIDDIMRLCSVESTIPSVPGWRGRFNKGFKSLFQVTEGVKVTSGPYSFELRDLMLLDPMEPLPDPDLAGRPTTFEFLIPLRIRRDFLSEGGKPPRVRAFGVESLVFLRNIDHIEISEGKKTLLEFGIERKPAPGLAGWEFTTITDLNRKEKKESRFLTFSGSPQGQRFCVAIKLSEGFKPFPLESHKRRLFRTFPLEQPAEFAPFLIEADFSTDQGRLGLREFESSGNLVLSAIRSVVLLVKSVIERDGKDQAVWLNWVTWLDLRSIARAADVFPSISIELRNDLKAFEEWLLGKIPMKGALLPLDQIVIPSPLLFKLVADPECGLILRSDSDCWLSAEVATVIRQEFERSRSSIGFLRLNAHTEELINNGTEIDGLKDALVSAHNRGLAGDQFEQMELWHARWIIDPPASVVRTPDLVVSTEERIDFNDILEAWDEVAAVQEFTVAGPLGRLILPNGGGDAAIAALLKRPESIEGKAAWYRLLCLGCSFSTLLGTSPRERVIGLWGDRLGADFWNKTIPDSLGAAGKAEFNRSLDAFFEKIIHKLFSNGNASGEDAEFWRRVFYDFRKMHYFVFRNHLPETILEYTSFSQADGIGLIRFLKSGEIQDEFRDPNQSRFTGVIGQSMSSPLLFIMRELARLGVIDHRFSSACYYMNRPARRVASWLGWIRDDGFSVPTFSDLLLYSQAIHETVVGSHPELQGYYDLPLQWYALTRH